MSDHTGTAEGQRLAATLRGIVYTTRTASFAEFGEGTYTREGMLADVLAAKPVKTECPFCHERLRDVTKSKPRRVARVLQKLPDDRALVVGHDIPKTHRVLACFVCKMAFTQPKRQPAAGR